MTRTLSRGIAAAILGVLLVAVFCLVTPRAAWAANDTSADLAAGSIAIADDDSDEPATYGTVETKVKTKAGHILLKKSYLIAPASDSAQLSHLMGAKGSSVKSVAQNNANTVKWHIEFTRNGINAYTIKNLGTKKVLAVNGSADEGDSVSLGGSEKYWDITQTSTGYKISPHSNSNLALALKGSNFVLQEADDSKVEQRFWLFDPEDWKASNVLKNGNYTLSTMASNGKLLTITGSTAKNNAKAMMAANSGNAIKMFEITNVGGAYYKIANTATGKALTAKGKKVVQSIYNKSKAQQWKATVSPEGQIVLTNRKTGKLLTASTSKVSLSAGKTATATEAQRWVVSPTVTTMSDIELHALTYANKYGGRVKGKLKEKVKGKWKVKKQKQYYLSIDMSTHTAVLFFRATETSPWTCVRTVTVSTGKGNNTAVANRLSTGRKHHVWDHYDENYRAYYWTGLNYGSWTHSVLYYPGTNNVKDSRLGYSISGGCVRMALENAKWMYDHMPEKFGVSTYY